MFEISEVKDSFLNSFPSQRIFYTERNSNILESSLNSISSSCSEYFLNMVQDSLDKGFITEYELDEKGRLLVSTSSDERIYFEKSVVAGLLSFLGITSYLSKEVLGCTENVCGLPLPIKNGLLEIVVNSLHYFVCQVVEDRVVSINLPDKKNFRFDEVLVPGDYRLNSLFKSEIELVESKKDLGVKVLEYTDDIRSSASIYFHVSFGDRSDRFDGVYKLGGLVGPLAIGKRIGVYDRNLEMAFVASDKIDTPIDNLENRLLSEVNEEYDYSSILSSILHDPSGRYDRMVDRLQLVILNSSSFEYNKKRTFGALVDEVAQLISLETRKSSEKNIFMNLMGIILYKKLVSCKKCGGTGCNC